MTSARIGILDGWRAMSILFVLAGHLLPMGPHHWGINGSLAVGGLALFFSLSGFLITRFLLDSSDVAEFLRRRLFRIVPLAWAAMLLLALVTGADGRTLVSNLLFVANLPPQHLLPGGAHLWSLCLEVQFYFGAALLVGIGGRRSLLVLPLLCVAVTALRVAAGADESIVTWFRLDDILAGATMALLCESPRSVAAMRRLPTWSPLILLGLLLFAAGPWGGPLSYLRSYLAAAAIGFSIHAATPAVRRLLSSRPAAYIAAISYALYVFHLMFAATWLGTGGELAKYAKRPLLLACTFLAAHLSTFYYERPLIAWGRRWGRR